MVVDEARRHCLGAGVVTIVDAANMASRRVLEKNHFVLADTRPVATEPSDAPMAIYRLTSLVPGPRGAVAPGAARTS